MSRHSLYQLCLEVARAAWATDREEVRRLVDSASYEELAKLFNELYPPYLYVNAIRFNDPLDRYVLFPSLTFNGRPVSQIWIYFASHFALGKSVTQK